MPDFLVTGLEIKELWGRKTVAIEFEPDVNILVGRNGTGKTTVLNLLNAALTCDIVILDETDFREIKVRLKHGKQQQTINVSKGGEGELVEYRFRGGKGIPVPLWGSRRLHSLRAHSMRLASQRMLDASEDVRRELAEIVDVHWLSVHRTPEREREREERMPAVDAKLNDLLEEFTSYQLLLETRLAEVSQQFQEEVSLSMLYDPELDAFSAEGLDLDLKSEKKRLNDAYRELGIGPSVFRKRLQTHMERLSDGVDAWRKFVKTRKGIDLDDVLVLGLLKRTERIISLADNAQEEKLRMTGQRARFVTLCNEFFEDKSIRLGPGAQLLCSLDDQNEADEENTRSVPLDKLSSGEKQLLIMLIETLVQRNEPCVFMTDEPEISLHVAWQKKVLSSIRELNPNSQLIVATHSPEIISDFGEHTIDMQDVMEALADANA